VSNFHHDRPRALVDNGGHHARGQACDGPGSVARYLASGRRGRSTAESSRSCNKRGSAALRRGSAPAPGLSLGRPGRARADPRPQQTTDQPGPSGRTADAGSLASFSAHYCPARGHRLKAALRASLRDGFASLDPAATPTDLGACENDAADWETQSRRLPVSLGNRRGRSARCERCHRAGR
jgi:hypothetical protein